MEASEADRRSHPEWEFVLRMGGPSAVGRMCEITPQAVSQWRHTGIPKAQMKYLQLLHPAVFAIAPPTDAPISQAGELDAV